MDTMEKARDRALEVGIYLPLGAYSKLKESVTEIDAHRLRRRYQDFVDRGEDRVKPLERKVSGKFRELRSGAKQAATTGGDKAAARVDQFETDATSSAGKARKRARAAAAQVAPKMPRVAAPADSRGLPIAGYDELTVGEIKSHLNGLTQTDLAKVYKYERSKQNRSTVLEAIEGKLVELPVPTYDALTVDEVNRRLDGLTKEEIGRLRSYEADTKARQTILDRMDSRLS